MPARNVVPKPLQKPHPPLWVASSRRETTMVAGPARHGLTRASAFETPEEAEERVDEYYQLVREECYPIGEAINPALGVVSVLSCFDTDEEAIDKGQEGAQFFAYSLGYYYNPFTGGNHKPGRREHLRRLLTTPARAALGPVRRRLPRVRRLRRRRSPARSRRTRSRAPSGARPSAAAASARRTSSRTRCASTRTRTWT